MSNLKAIKRESTSSGSNNKLRSEGLIPAILYGGKDKNINIEKVLSELESIVNKMEEDNLNLEDSLSSYEKGILLVKTAQENLKKIEQRVQILSKNNELKDFESND